MLLEISRFESCFYLLGFPGNSVGEETTYSAGDPGSISGGDLLEIWWSNQ